MKEIITIDDFAKLDIRVGTVLDCTEKEKSAKLLRLTVDFGEDGIRTILSGIKAWYSPEDLKGRQFAFILNLAPRKMMGEESLGMLLTAAGDRPAPLSPGTHVEPGSRVI
jgi:methionyl-tRNA synthetase